MDSAPLQPPTPAVPPSTGLSFASQSQPAGALFNFPSSSSQQPAQPTPRSTRSSVALHLSPSSAESPAPSPAPVPAQAQPDEQEQEHKAERRRLRRQAQARKDQQQQAGYQDKEKQEGLMKSLLGMLVDDQPTASTSSPAQAQAPPTPTPTSPSHSHHPSFLAEDPLSSDPDSSSDDDLYGRPKPARPPRYNSKGLKRPTPSYYYDAEFDPATGGDKKRGRRGGLKGIPVFEPSMKEFEGEGGFYGYVKRIEKYGMRSGVVKVIPPKEWTDSLPSTSEPLKDIRLREPISQHILGSQGLYRVTNVAKTRIWNPAQWKEMSENPKWEAPDFKAEKRKGDRSERPVGGRASRSRGGAGKEEEGEGEEGDDEEENEGEEVEKKVPRGRVKLGRGGGRASGAGRGGMKAGFLNKGKGKGKATADDDEEDDDDESLDPKADQPPIQQATPPDTTDTTSGEGDPEGDVEMVDATSNPTASTSTSTTVVPIPNKLPLPHPSHMRPVLAEVDVEEESTKKGKGKGKAAEEDDEEKEEEKPQPRLTRAQIAAAAAAAEAEAQATKGGKKGKGKASTIAASSTKKPTNSKSALSTPAASPKPSTSTPRPKRPTNLQRAEPTEAEWKAFEERFEELPHGMKREEYTVEMMREVERRYWRTLTFGESPMYGADMNGSIFSSSTKAWNVASLGDLLPRLAPPSCQIPGVVSPYLYFGMWRATFAWHVEDADLYSINYIHFGAPKFWYSVPQEQSERFERVMEGFFPTDRSKCSQFLRHKAFLASPRVLANSGITLNRVAQLPGEFILTYPKGYHSGFNLGFNCAESINFATERWLPLGKVAKSCVCIGDSVNIDVDAWLHEAAKSEAEARGEVYPPTRALPPTPPPAHQLSPPLVPAPTTKRRRPSDHPQQQKQIAPAPRPGWDYVPVIPGEKDAAALVEGRRKSKSSYARPSGPGEMELDGPPVSAPRGQKRTRVEGEPSGKKAPPPPSSSTSVGLGLVPVVLPSVPAKPPTPVVAEQKPTFVCALCPDSSNDGLVRIAEPGVRSQKELAAHRVCVMFTPATWIEIDPTTQDEIVRGYAGIEKARWKLKCQLCSEAHGTKVQCTKGKCTKAVHVTCAMHTDSGFFLDATVPGEEGHTAVSLLDQARAEMDPMSPKKSKVAIPQRTSPLVASAALPAPVPVEDDEAIKLTVLCRTHNPDFKLQEAARKASELKERVEGLKPQSRLRVRTPGGLFEVTLAENLPAKESVAVLYDDGTRFETKWKNIAWEDAAEARKKKEQAAAQRARTESVYVYDSPVTQPSKRARASYAPPPPPPGAYAYPPPPPSYYHPQQQVNYAAFPPYYPPPPGHQAPQSGQPPAPYRSPQHAQMPLYSYPPPPPGYPYYPPPPSAAHGGSPYSAFPHSSLAPPPPQHQHQQHQQQQGYPAPSNWSPHHQHPAGRHSPYGHPPLHLAPSPGMGYAPMPSHYAPPPRNSTPAGPSPRFQPQQHQQQQNPSPRMNAPPLQPMPSPHLVHPHPQHAYAPSSPAPNRSPSFANLLNDHPSGEQQQGRFPSQSPRMGQSHQQEVLPAVMPVREAIMQVMGGRS